MAWEMVWEMVTSPNGFTTSAAEVLLQVRRTQTTSSPIPVQPQPCRFTWAVVLLIPGTVSLSSGRAGFKQELKLSLYQGSKIVASLGIPNKIRGVPHPPPRLCLNLCSAVCKEQDLSPRASQLSSGVLTARFLSKGRCSPLPFIHQLGSSLTQKKWGFGAGLGQSWVHHTHTHRAERGSHQPSVS